MGQQSIVQLLDIRELLLIQESVEIANGKQGPTTLLSRVFQHLNRMLNDSVNVFASDRRWLFCCSLFVLGKRHQIKEVARRFLLSAYQSISSEKCLQNLGQRFIRKLALLGARK